MNEFTLQLFSDSAVGTDAAEAEAQPSEIT